MANLALQLSYEEGAVDEASRLTAWRPQDWPVAADWTPVVERFVVSVAGQELAHFVRNRLASGAVIYPPAPFRALQLTPLDQVKVVILGQDPYHGRGQAQGLAFSVPAGVRTPPSLHNIFKEIGRGAGAGVSRGEVAGRGVASSANSLDRWARQGVLLLNTCLTVEDGRPGSHAKQGWEALTDEIIRTIWQSSQPVVFMLWGAHAQAKMRLIKRLGELAVGMKPVPGHLVLTANHPSPLSALRPPQPFLGCGHFEVANAHLVGHGLAPIDWFAQA